MSLLLLFNDDGSGGSTPEAGSTLDCLADLFFVEATVEAEAKTGVFAVLPEIEASASIQGYSVMSAVAEIQPLDALVTARVTGQADCAVAFPRLFASMQAQVVGGMMGVCEIGGIEATARIGRSGNTVVASVDIPTLAAYAAMGSFPSYSFPEEDDVVLKHEPLRRLL